MDTIQQMAPSDITNEDWIYYLSTTPEQFIREMAESLKKDNCSFIKESFQKLLYEYLSHQQSRYSSQYELIPTQRLFRARVYGESDVNDRLTFPEKYKPFQGYDKANSGAAPPEKALPGRINPKGISYLYTASDPITALLEIRAQPGETVSIATIYPKRELHFFNLTNGYSAIATETSNKSKWGNDFILELERLFQSPYSVIGNYDLCQYISCLVKSWNLDGIMYRASHRQETLTPYGINYTIFDPLKCDVVSSQLYYIIKTSIETDPPIE